MNEIINQVFDNMISAASEIYAIKPVQIAVVAAAIVLCIAGYKLLRGVTGLFGIGIGFAVGGVVAAMLPLPDFIWLHLVSSVIAMVIFGLLFGMLFFRFYRLGFFLLCGVIGAAVGSIPAMFLWEKSEIAAYVIIGVAALLFAIAGVVMDRLFGIVLTSLCGMIAAFPLMSLLGQDSLLMTIGAGAGMTVVGLLIQSLTNRGESKPWWGADKNEDDDEDEETELTSEASENEKSEEETEQAAPTEPTEETENTEKSDDITSISDAVAAQMGLEDTEPTATYTHTAHPPVNEPEAALDSTKVLPSTEELKTEAFSEETPVEETLKTDWFEEPKTEAFDENHLDQTRTDIELPKREESVPTEPETTTASDFVVEEEIAEETKKKKKGKLRLIFPLLMLAAAGVFAGLNVQIAEVTFLLLFLCYALKFYKTTALASLILCVRSGLNAYLLYSAGAALKDMVYSAGQAGIFLLIGIVCVWTAAAAKKD